MTETEIHKLMTYIFADHDHTISSEKRKYWYDQFRNVPLDVAMEAARRMGKNKSYGIPKASDLHASLEELQRLQTDTDENSWTIVIEAAQRKGFIQGAPHLESNHPEIWAAAKGLWREICYSDETDMGALRAQFWKILQAGTKREYAKSLGLPPPVRTLIGIK